MYSISHVKLDSFHGIMKLDSFHVDFFVFCFCFCLILKNSSNPPRIAQILKNIYDILPHSLKSQFTPSSNFIKSLIIWDINNKNIRKISEYIVYFSGARATFNNAIL